jgi:riboflavin kinase/FMN adenylyltransferase
MPDAHAPSPLPSSIPRTVVTVGTFDGVHRGHWRVLQELGKHASENEAPSVLLTFHPHPLRIVSPDSAPPLLTTPLEKKEILAESGLDYALFLPFTPALARYEPRRFVEEILIGRLRMCHLVIGYDHGFGRGRSGGVDMLRRIGAELGFGVTVVDALFRDGEPISSTRIRKALLAGDVLAAADGLGRAYSLRGLVVRGDGRGRSLGFPTANIQMPNTDKLLPLSGVYAVTAAVHGKLLKGVMHLGPRPTFRGSPPSVELHLFDFDADIYGDEVRVDFCARIREIHRFARTAELIDAIREDCEMARRLFREGATACHNHVAAV